MIALLKLIFRLFFFTGRISNGITFLKPLPENEEKELFNKVKQGDKSAEEKIVAHNMRLVAHIIKKYKNSNYDTDELISVGSFGLLKAVRTFTSDHGNNFSTYASRCITNEVLMLMRSDKKRNGDISLDLCVATDKDGNSVTIKEILPVTGESIEEKTETKILVSNVVSLMKKLLTKREYLVISMRYGLNGHKEETQEIIARKLGISRSYISRIEKQTIEKIRVNAIEML